MKLNSSMKWVEHKNNTGSDPNYIEVFGKDCSITIEPRLYDCGRGNYIAKIHAIEPFDFGLGLDDQDGWPRYYFDLERAKLECEAWLIKRKQAI